MCDGWVQGEVFEWGTLLSLLLYLMFKTSVSSRVPVGSDRAGTKARLTKSRPLEEPSWFGSSHQTSQGDGVVLVSSQPHMELSAQCYSPLCQTVRAERRRSPCPPLRTGSSPRGRSWSAVWSCSSPPTALCGAHCRSERRSLERGGGSGRSSKQEVEWS